MYKEVLEYLQMSPASDSSSDYVVLRSPLGSSVGHERRGGGGGRWATSWSVAALWAALSLLVTLASTAGFAGAEWLVRERGNGSTAGGGSVLAYERASLRYTLGLFSVCFRDAGGPPGGLLRCHRFAVARFPSAAWQASCLLYGAGCVLQGCGAVLLLVSLLANRGAARRIGTHLVAHAYVIAGFVQTLSLLLYPLILDTHVGRLHCGSEAHAYGPDQCRIGWAYVASTAGTLLTFYCPFLAYFSFYRVYGDTKDVLL